MIRQTRHRHADFVCLNDATGGLYAGHSAIGLAHTGDLTVLNDVYAIRVRLTRKAPRNRVVARHHRFGLVHAAEYLEARFGVSARVLSALIQIQYRSSMLGLMLYSVFLLLMHLVYPAGLGFGDVKLAVLLGFVLGWVGGSKLDAVRAVMLALLIGSALGVVLGFGRHRGMPLAELATGDVETRGYLSWIVGKDFPPHVGEICCFALEGRSEAELTAWVEQRWGPATPKESDSLRRDRGGGESQRAS